MVSVPSNNKNRKKMGNRPDNDSSLDTAYYNGVSNHMNKETYENFKILFFLIILVLSIYAIAMTYIVMHEAIHKKIFERYQINSRTYLYLWINGYTLPDQADYFKCDDSCKMQHALNDIFGYYIALVIMASVILFILNLLIKHDS